MDLTVIVCSANRQELLENFLIRWNKRCSRAKLLVVENSQLETTFLYLNSKYSSPQIEIIRSAPPGLSRARNLALSKVTTRYATFTDDDCVVTENFEARILDSFDASNCSVSFGKILPLWPNNFDSSKISGQARESLALFDLGKRSRELREFEYGVGANMSFDLERTQKFKFNEGLGRSGGNLLSGEEWELQNRLRLEGHRFYYNAEVVVFHLVDSNRLNPGWLISRFAWQGVTDAEMSSPDLHSYHLQELMEFSGDMRSVLSNSWDDLDRRLSFIRSFVALSLNSNAGHKAPRSTKTIYSRPIPTTVTKLIVEFSQGHQFLPQLLKAKNTYTWFLGSHPWNSSSDQIAQELSSLLRAINDHPRIVEVVFTSIESLLLKSRIDNFLEFLILSNCKITGVLHRFSIESELLDNLKEIGPHIEIYVLSRTMQEQLKEIEIDVKFAPVIGTLNPKNEVTMVPPLSKLRVFGVMGEIRDLALLAYIQEKILELGNKRQGIQIRFVGGCKDSRILHKLTELKRLFGNSIDISNVIDTTNSKEFRGISPYMYLQHLSACDFRLKFQIEEINVASAVIADALTAGVPVVALRGTEAARQIQEILPQLIFEPTSPIFVDLLEFNLGSIVGENLKDWMRLQLSAFRLEVLGE